MVKKSYYDILFYPIVLWVIFDIVAFAAGFTNYVALPAQVLLGDGAITIAALFGIWTGRRACKAFGILWVSILAALMLTVIMGFVATLMSYTLSAYSQSFISYVSQGGPTTGILGEVLGVAVVLWFEMAMVAMVGAALAHEFSSNK